jgi:hypothetical protein
VVAPWLLGMSLFATRNRSSDRAGLVQSAPRIVENWEGQVGELLNTAAPQLGIHVREYGERSYT